MADAARPAQRLTILSYHSVLDTIAPRVGCVSLEAFDQHIRMLVSRYNVLPLGQAMEMICSNTLPERPVSITFDDGYVDNFEHAFPTLVKYKCPATIFVVSDFIDRNIRLVDDDRFGPMTWEQLGQMKDSGLIDVQSHTKSHRILSRLSDEQIALELNESKRPIGERLNGNCDMLAYPNGQPRDIGRQVERAVRVSDYHFAFSSIWGRASRHSRPEAIPRIRVDAGDASANVMRKVDGHYDFVGLIQRARARLGIESTSTKAGSRAA